MCAPVAVVVRAGVLFSLSDGVARSGALGTHVGMRRVEHRPKTSNAERQTAAGEHGAYGYISIIADFGKEDGEG